MPTLGLLVGCSSAADAPGGHDGGQAGADGPGSEAGSTSGADAGPGAGEAGAGTVGEGGVGPGADAGASTDGGGGDAAVCATGAACVVAGTCHAGTLACTDAGAVCNDSGQRAPNGAACGAGMVCDNATCRACAQGGSCTPMLACHMGVLDCSLGIPLCMDTGNGLADGTSRGSGQSCQGGVCVTNGTCGDPQTDAHNCGYCGHDCQGGACTVGRSGLGPAPIDHSMVLQ